ncbi:MAG TPA: hypothetical protein VK841_21155 [Polyangiaceae bacterium]|jgi:hypothetical protein|nr:hypothetical protein [Polyangiaceae bacterium]
MIDHFANLTPQPLVYSVLPPVIYAPVAGPTDPDDCILRYQIIPIIRQVAGEKGSPVIDVYGATAQRPEYFVDPNTNRVSVYPNMQGHGAIAQAIDYALEGPIMDYGSDYAVGGACDGGTPILLPEGGPTPQDAGALASDGGSSGMGGDAETTGNGASPDAGPGQAPPADGGQPAGGDSGPVADASRGQIRMRTPAKTGTAVRRRRRTGRCRGSRHRPAAAAARHRAETSRRDSGSPRWRSPWRRYGFACAVAELEPSDASRRAIALCVVRVV